MQKNENGSDNVIDSVPTRRKPSARYTRAVLHVRKLQHNGHQVVLAIYDALVEIRDTGVFKEGPYPTSFEQFIQQEFSISPVRFAHLEHAIKRFGRDAISHYGHESVITMLRLPPDSIEETTAFHKINEMEKLRGRAPHAESVRRIVSDLVMPQKPADSVLTESARLRQQIRNQQDEIGLLKMQLQASEKALRDMTKAHDKAIHERDKAIHERDAARFFDKSSKPQKMDE